MKKIVIKIMSFFALFALVFSHAGILPLPTAYAALQTWDLNTPADYTASNVAEIEFDGNLGKLKIMWTEDNILGDDGSSHGIGVGDIDNDGDLDIHVSHLGIQNKLWINQGGAQGGTLGTFLHNDIATDLGISFDSSMGDIDNDGDLDIYVSNRGQNKLWINQGGAQGGTLGTFLHNDIATDLGNSYDAAMGDIDGDGDLDIYVANNGQNKLWINQGGAQGGTLGTFSANDISPSDLGYSSGALIVDVDGDSDLDIYVNNIDNQQNKLWINQGGAQGGTLGTFLHNDIATDLGNSLMSVAGDIDGDGDFDIYVANNGQNKLWINDGTGSFTANDIVADLGASYDAAIGDIDNDGDFDIHVANWGSQNKLWIQGYSTAKPYIQANSSQTFTAQINSFIETLGSNNQGTVSYQVSTDNGTTWHYWNGTAWTTTTQTNGTETSPASDINTNIATLDTDGGDFLWRAYFNSDGTQKVELDAINISYDLDTTAPATPSSAPDLQTSSDTGTSNTDNITSDNTPTFDIICTEVGSTITLYTDNPAANTVAATHTCTTVGTESITANTLTDGTHNISYTETDTSNNESGHSPSLSTTIDTTAPATLSINPVNEGDTTITGTGEDGATITITGTTCDNSPITVSGGTWTCTNPNPTPSAGDTITVISTDGSGNTSSTSITLATPPSSSSSSSIRYSCKDPQATNYSSFGRHKLSLCIYDIDKEPILHIAEAEEGTETNSHNTNIELEQLLKDKSCSYFTQYMKKGDQDGKQGRGKQKPGVTSKIHEVSFLQSVLNALGYQAGPIDGIFGIKTHKAVQNFQNTYRKTVLDPWNLTQATGYFYQSSKVRMNEVLGCEDSITLDNGVFVD